MTSSAKQSYLRNSSVWIYWPLQWISELQASGWFQCRCIPGSTVSILATCFPSHFLFVVSFCSESSGYAALGICGGWLGRLWHCLYWTSQKAFWLASPEALIHPETFDCSHSTPSNLKRCSTQSWSISCVVEIWLEENNCLWLMTTTEHLASCCSSEETPLLWTKPCFHH